jgi:hypothetical protein
VCDPVEIAQLGGPKQGPGPVQRLVLLLMQASIRDPSVESRSVRRMDGFPLAIRVDRLYFWRALQSQGSRTWPPFSHLSTFTEPLRAMCVPSSNWPCSMRSVSPFRSAVSCATRDGDVSPSRTYGNVKPLRRSMVPPRLR